MSHKTRRRLRLLVAVSATLALPAVAQAAATGLECSPVASGSTANHAIFNVVANTGYMQTPDGNSVFMWSYSLDPGEGSMADPPLPTFQTPGPNLCVNEGVQVTVNLVNQLPENTSIVFPGQVSTVAASGGTPGLLTTEANANGGTVSYTFTASQPGTYIYESGSNVSKQIEMGLYGAVIIRPAAGANFAYDNAATQFDPTREYMLMLAEIDPVLHHAVEAGLPYDFTKLHDHYYTINGRSFPDTIEPNGTDLVPAEPYGALVKLQAPLPGQSLQPALIRMLNVGTNPHPFHPHGNHTIQIAQDGRLILVPGTTTIAGTEHFGETIGTGQTQDYTITWANQNDPFDPASDPFPIDQPDYQNLTFKGGDTFYSGNPYLGQQGTFPAGTTTQNICGEWYFPLHSHALNEFSNYDEGFGGMGTLLRVDPPAGCSSAPTQIIGGVNGRIRAGTVASLMLADRQFLTIRAAKVSRHTRQTAFAAQFHGILAGSTAMGVTYTGKASLASAKTKLYYYRWNVGWVAVHASARVKAGMTTLAGPIPSSALGKGSHRGLVRIRVVTRGHHGFTTSADLLKLVYTAP